jgi:glycyl-radical enzyme activating protein
MVDTKGWIFNIQRYSTQDGPGIRTTVFFVGCPLKCFWCSNPESQFKGPKLLYFESKCTRCKRCIEVCPNKATSIGADGFIMIDRDKCVSCGKCVETCPNDARAISGELKTVDEVMKVVKKDSLFYRNSGGGVTASGGEPTYQPKFLLELFQACKKSRIHTCLDTCGYVSWQVLEEVLEYVNLILYDIKHMDSNQHIKLTGVDNKIILQNAERIAGKGIPLIIRVPLIPGYNDSKENLQELAKFATRLGVHKIDLIPYHELGVSKYERLGMNYIMAGTKALHKDEVDPIKRGLESYGLEVTIV